MLPGHWGHLFLSSPGPGTHSSKGNGVGSHLYVESRIVSSLVTGSRWWLPGRSRPPPSGGPLPKSLHKKALPGAWCSENPTSRPPISPRAGLPAQEARSSHCFTRTLGSPQWPPSLHAPPRTHQEGQVGPAPDPPRAPCTSSPSRPGATDPRPVS